MEFDFNEASENPFLRNQMKDVDMADSSYGEKRGIFSDSGDSSRWGENSFSLKQAKREIISD